MAQYIPIYNFDDEKWLAVKKFAYVTENNSAVRLIENNSAVPLIFMRLMAMNRKKSQEIH